MRTYNKWPFLSIVTSNPPPQEWDIRGYRYLVLWRKSDRGMQSKLQLVTDGDRTDELYFGFPADRVESVQQ